MPIAFCVGQAKAGTASLYGMLSTAFRAAHEPERARTLDLILRKARSELDTAAVGRELEARDQRLDLEFDIAWANQFLIDDLVTTFPDTRFIVLVREPRPWLQSIVGHLVSRDIPPDVRAFLDWWFKPEQYPYATGDRRLGEHGVYSIAAFLQAWRRHVVSCTDRIPADRRLVLRTERLPESHGRIAGFLGIPADSIDLSKSHLNRGTWTGDLDELVSPDYVGEAIDSICGDVELPA